MGASINWNGDVELEITWLIQLGKIVQWWDLIKHGEAETSERKQETERQKERDKKVDCGCKCNCHSLFLGKYGNPWNSPLECGVTNDQFKNIKWQFIKWSHDVHIIGKHLEN